VHDQVVTLLLAQLDDELALLGRVEDRRTATTVKRRVTSASFDQLQCNMSAAPYRGLV